ncbi:MAG: precorrin-6y C5,15-methyltransferase (decarboxylating) subunit CbiE [Bacillota bacterium]
MRVTLVGTGCGDPGTMTEEVKNVLAGADVVIGAPRLIEAVRDYLDDGALKMPEISPSAILDAIRNIAKKNDSVEELSVCVAYSGDSGFYSGTRSLLPLLEEAGIEAEVMPGISSIQVMASRLRTPWQDWKLVSAHGTDCDPVTEVMCGKKVFFLTGGQLGPAELCHQLTLAGLGDLKVTVGERLSYEDEKISAGTAEEFSGREFDSLSVMLAEPAPYAGDMTPGMDDGQFIRGDIPMTKQTVRAAIISKMGVEETDTVWDVGAGTGSVSVELAMKASKGRVWAIEREPEGCTLIESNKKKFGVWNLNVVPGSAPEALIDLPAPDRVFIGGSGGNLDDIIDEILTKNENALICVSAIVMETMADTVKIMAKRGMDTDMIQVSVNTSREIGDRHMMMAGNPIFIITGQKHSAKAEEEVRNV